MLDFDDVALRGHPSTVLTPANLVEAEVLGAGCRDMLVAYIAGYETWAELVRRDVPMYHQKGFHPTGIFGAVGAAAACAKLRKLDANRTAMAIALGLSQASGIMSNFGTMTKPFHAGKAAHSGIMAARLAEAGMTANTDALEHPQGFLSAFSPENNPDLAGDGKLGEDWANHPPRAEHQEVSRLLRYASGDRRRFGSPGRTSGEARGRPQGVRAFQFAHLRTCCAIGSPTLAWPPSSAWSSRWRAG